MTVVKRVAYRFATNVLLREMQTRLDQLESLDVSLSRLENSFDMHFATDLTTDVAGHFDTLRKSVEGLQIARMTFQGLEKLTRTFPNDMDAVKAKLTAERLVDRFERHVERASKAIRVLSAKTMPKLLKTMATKAEGIIAGKLVDPSKLRITPWQNVSNGVTTYQAVFYLEGVVSAEGKYERTLTESLDDPNGPHMTGKPGSATVLATAESFAQAFIDGLGAWNGIKLNADESAIRRAAALRIKSRLEVLIRQSGNTSDPVTVSDDSSTIRASYLAIPKETLEEMDEWECREKVSTIETEARGTLEAQLAPVKDQMKDLLCHVSEKGWMYITVTLK